MNKTVLKLFQASMILILLVVLIFWYLGFFDNLYISEKEDGPYRIVYEEVSLFETTKDKQNKIFRQLNHLGIKAKKNVSIYYSEYDSTLNDVAGVVVDKDDWEKLDVYDDVFSIYEQKNSVRLVADYPLSNAFSEVGGAYRAKKALRDYCKKKGYKFLPIIEIYDRGNKRIYYIMEIEQQL